MNRKRLNFRSVHLKRQRLIGIAVGIVLCILLAAAGSLAGRKKNTEKAAAETSSAAVEAENNGAAETSEEPLTSADEKKVPEKVEHDAEVAAKAEAATEAVKIVEKPVVTKHPQNGTHMVHAGNMTISVPTTIDGLAAEGAVFRGADDLVLSGKTGSCRVQYKGSFGCIRINVTNNTEDDMAVRDCTVTGIEIASTTPDPELTLYGIPMGATRLEIAEVYGEPFSKTFDDEAHMSNMVYQFGTEIYSNQVVMIIFKDSKAVSASFDDFSLVK